MAQQRMSGHQADCIIIIGGGPAGLTAATYLGRFRRRVIVIDAGQSRAKWIPVTHNCPGFPDGISGPALLERLRAQAVRYGADLRDDSVREVRRDGTGFIVTASSSSLRACSVVMATGITDTLPDAPGIPAMVKEGILRLCPICDGYEVIGQRVGVLGPPEDATKKALFMRTFTPHVTVLLTEPATTLDAPARARLAGAGIEVAACVPGSIRAEDGLAVITLADGETRAFDTIYPAMGCSVRSKLATDMGALCDEVGNLGVDPHQRTAIPGLYAAGDVVNEINQIAVAFGHAAIAASDIHNYLAQAAAPAG